MNPDLLYVKSDNGSSFCSDLTEFECKSLGIKMYHSRPYSPFSNGMAERLNQTIKNGLLRQLQQTRSIIKTKHTKEELKADLKVVLASYNENVYVMTDEKPRYLFCSSDISPEFELKMMMMDQAKALTKDGVGLYRHPENLHDFKRLHTPNIQSANKMMASSSNENEQLYLTCFCHTRSVKVYPMTDADKQKVKYRLLRPLKILSETVKNGEDYFKAEIDGLGIKEIKQSDNLIISDVV